MTDSCAIKLVQFIVKLVCYKNNLILFTWTFLNCIKEDKTGWDLHVHIWSQVFIWVIWQALCTWNLNTRARTCSKNNHWLACIYRRLQDGAIAITWCPVLPISTGQASKNKYCGSPRCKIKGLLVQQSMSSWARNSKTNNYTINELQYMRGKQTFTLSLFESRCNKLNSWLELRLKLQNKKTGGGRGLSMLMCVQRILFTYFILLRY